MTQRHVKNISLSANVRASVELIVLSLTISIMYYVVKYDNNELFEIIDLSGI